MHAFACEGLRLVPRTFLFLLTLFTEARLLSQTYDKLYEKAVSLASLLISQLLRIDRVEYYIRSSNRLITLTGVKHRDSRCPGHTVHGFISLKLLMTAVHITIP